MEKHQCEGSYLWLTFLSPKSDYIMYSSKPRDGQSSATVHSDFCCIGLFYVKRLRLECSNSCGRNTTQ